ncbi:MAG: glycoside hydrolase family 76 protein, partial [Phycisphaerae bacterium]
MELLMLAEAAKCQLVDSGILWKFVQTLVPYWRVANGVGGFDVLPGNAPLDRYYDDNGWMTWGFLRAYSATYNRKYLAIAQRDFKFILSGESSALGGGIFWHEQAKTSKNTCSNGPAIIDALKLYSVTRRQFYLHTARKLYVWVNKHLQDRKDYLYFDHITLNGTITRTKWTYNTGTMLIANCLFYRITRQQKYLRRAK